jgi:membrane associated rhomboid family serine protease
VFDTFSRGIFSISASMPFVGASGAIFGLAGVAMLVKPYEKLPSALVVLFIVPLIMLAVNSPTIIKNPFVMILMLMLAGLLTVVVLFEIPSLPTIAVFFYYTVFTLLFMFIEGFADNVSYIGHLGGLFGGVVSFFLFCRKSEKEK